MFDANILYCILLSRLLFLCIPVHRVFAIHLIFNYQFLIYYQALCSKDNNSNNNYDNCIRISYIDFDFGYDIV